MRYNDTSAKRETQDNLVTALKLAKAGLPVFPARASNKRPHVKDWPNVATTDTDRLKSWWRKWPDAMPALPTGKRSGVAVLDVDMKDGKDGMATLRELGFDPDSLSSAVIATPSGGQHIYFRHAEGLGSNAGKIGPGVDMRADGGFVVAPGAINGAGAYGSLSGPLKRTLSDLPKWPTKLAPPPRKARKSSGEKTGLPFEEIRDALMAIPNDASNADADSRDWWLHMGMALHHETDGSEEGHDAFQDWSELHDTYDYVKTSDAWFSFGGEGRTGATILSEAAKHGWRNDAHIDRLFDDMMDEGELDKLTLGDIDRMLGLAPDSDKPRLTFLSPSECDDLPTRSYVIKRLLAEGDIATIVGAPGAGKSLLAPYLGYAVARGDKAFGRRTRQGGVFYVAAEDSHGMRARLKALREEHGEAENFKLVEGVSDLLSTNAPDLKALAKAVKAQRPSLIVIDTIAVAFPGLEENDAKSMGRVVAVARHLTKWGAAVVLIHHDTKDGSNGLPRGHSLLNGALDANLYLKRKEGVVTGQLTKNRNGSTDEKLAFTVGVKSFGEDEDGDPKTAAFCSEADADATSDAPRLSRGEIGVMEHFHHLEAGGVVKEHALRVSCLDSRNVSPSDKEDSRRRTLDNALKGLIEKSILEFDGGVYRLVSPQPDPFDEMAEGE